MVLCKLFSTQDNVLFSLHMGVAACETSSMFYPGKGKTSQIIHSAAAGTIPVAIRVHVNR
jgi:hypothetical protein